MSQPEWYYQSTSGQIHGPIDGADLFQLRDQGHIHRDTPIKFRKNGEWIPSKEECLVASSISALFPEDQQSCSASNRRIVSIDEYPDQDGVDYADNRVSTLIKTLDAILKQHGDMQVFVAIEGIPGLRTKRNPEASTHSIMTCEFNLKIARLMDDDTCVQINVVPPENLRAK